jgi:hypothetical protein
MVILAAGPLATETLVVKNVKSEEPFPAELLVPLIIAL